MRKTDYTNQSAEAKKTAILNMSFDFTSMARAFESGSKRLFIVEVRDLLNDLNRVKKSNKFNTHHNNICKWGERTIKSSHQSKHTYASYGQIAKTLNVMLKATVYYCKLPSTNQADTVAPMLHPAIDNPMMKYLKTQYPKHFPHKTLSIADVDKNKYHQLLSLVEKDISYNFNDSINMIQWEDILWTKMSTKI